MLGARRHVTDDGFSDICECDVAVSAFDTNHHMHDPLVGNVATVWRPAGSSQPIGLLMSIVVFGMVLTFFPIEYLTGGAFESDFEITRSRKRSISLTVRLLCRTDCLLSLLEAQVNPKLLPACFVSTATAAGLPTAQSDTVQCTHSSHRPGRLWSRSGYVSRARRIAPRYTCTHSS